MNYPNLFKSRYRLKGSDWLRRIDPDDLKAFVDIGLQAAEHGRKGGRALYMKRGREHMSKIGRIGAIASNVKQWWIKAARQEAEEL